MDYKTFSEIVKDTDVLDSASIEGCYRLEVLNLKLKKPLWIEVDGEYGFMKLIIDEIDYDALTDMISFHLENYTKVTATLKKINSLEFKDCSKESYIKASNYVKECKEYYGGY